MDFNYSEEEEAVRQLAAQIFSERSTHDRLKQVETEAGDDGPIDRDLYRELANVGLLGIHLGEEFGGAGLDFVAACLVIEAAGRTAAYVPVVETMVYGALPIARFGTDSQRKAWLPGVASGEIILTAAMAELAGEVIVPGGTEPITSATRRGDGSWSLSGTKACVPAALVADAILVPTTLREADGTANGAGVFIVDADASGLTKTRQTTTTGRPEAIVELVDVVVEPDRLLGDGTDGAAVILSIVEHATAALCIQEAGACASSTRADRRVHQDSRAVREADRHVPGRRAARRRCLRGHRSHQADRVAGRVAPGGWAPGHGRGGHRQVLGGRGWPARRPRGLAPPRRRGCRP